MGLLDDAIREHLELKRRRGADPGEVAREQHEALEPLAEHAPASDFEASTEEHSLEAGLAPDDETFGSDQAAQPQAIGDYADVEPGHAEPLSSHASQVAPGKGAGDSLEETAELDMNAVLEDEPLAGAEPEEQAQHPGDTPLVSEVPGEPASGPALETPAAAHGRAQTPSQQVAHDTSSAPDEMLEQERLQFGHTPQADSDGDR